MKRKLLLAIVALLCTVGLWADVVPTASTPAVGNSYYLYNPTTKSFLLSLNGTPYVRSVGQPLVIETSDVEGFVKLRLKGDDTGYFWGKYWASFGGSYATYPAETSFRLDKQEETDNYKLYANAWSGTNNAYVYVNASNSNRVACNSQEQNGLNEAYTLWQFVSEADYDTYIASADIDYSFSLIPSVDYTSKGSAPTGGKTYLLYNETKKFLYNDGNTPKISSSKTTYYTLETTGDRFYIKSDAGYMVKSSNNTWTTTTNGVMGDDAKWKTTLSDGKYTIQNFRNTGNAYFAPNSNGEDIACYRNKTALTGWYFIDLANKDLAVSLLYALQNTKTTYYTPAAESDAKSALLAALNEVYVDYVLAANFTSTTYNEGEVAIQTAVTTFQLAELKAELNALKATIDASYLNNADYEKVIGKERETLTTAKSIVATEETVEAYNTAVANVQAAITAFTTAKANYEALEREIAKAKALGIDATTADGYAATSSSTAATALASTQNLKVDEYNYVKDNYAYSVSLSSEWEKEGTNTKATTWNNEHWSDTNSDYINQDDSNGQGWNASSWSLGVNQNVTLPAGNYIFKVAGRIAQADQVTVSLVVTNTSGDSELGSVNDFPHNGSSARGIDTSGATNFSDDGTYANSNKGYGWEWRYVKFSLTEPATVNVAVNVNATASHMWASFGDYALLTDNEANVSLIAYNIALGGAKTARDNTADYGNVKGVEKANLLAAIKADDNLDKTNAEAIDAATTTLTDATTAFTTAKTNYDALATAITNATNITTAAVNVGTALFEHPASAKTALETATTDATTAWNATDATAASANAAAETLNTAISTYNTTINAPEAGKPYVIKNNTASGVLKIDNTVTVNAGAVVFFTAVTGGYVLSNADGAYISKKSGDNWTLETTTESSSAYVVNVNIVEGGYTIKGSKGLFGTDNTTAGSAVYADKTQAQNGVWTIEEGASATMAVKANKWGTFIAPFDVTIPAGVAAYKVNGIVNEKFMDKEAVETTIPANTPVVLNNTTDTDVSTVFNGINTATADSYQVGLLTGVYTAETVSAGNYVLQTQDGVQGFYVVEGNGLTAVPNRCYLTLPVDANVRALFFSDGETTAIEGIDAQTSGDYDAIYTASGVQVNALQKGLNIVVKDGKSHKIYVK